MGLSRSIDNHHTPLAPAAGVRCRRVLRACVGFGWVLLGVFCAAPAAAQPLAPVPADPRTPGTIRMAVRLQDIAVHADPTKNAFLNQVRVQEIGKSIRSVTDPAQVAHFGPLFASELLRSGHSEAALKQYRLLEQFFLTQTNFTDESKADSMRLMSAVSALRLGEQENCILSHNADSCLFPLEAGGYHQLPRGSRTTISILTGLLRNRPDDLRARWMLNVAHMTLGEWPDKVPPQWRIGPERFASDAPFPRFPEVAGPLGLDAEDLGGGTVIEDFDGDGFLDVLVSAWGLSSQIRYYHNDGKGGFVERTHEAGLDGLWGGLNLVSTDYDNDGRVDVMILRGAWLGIQGRIPPSLLHNNGDGTFSDVTEAAGLLAPHPSQTAAWFDYDGDGWLDVFIGTETPDPGPNTTDPCELFHNNGDGTFTDVAAASGVAVVGWVKAVACADYDGDGRPDLYLSMRNGGNKLLHNDGPATNSGAAPGVWRFSDTTAHAGVPGPQFSFPAWFFDYNQDGRPDLFVAGYHINDVGDIVADILGQPTDGEKSHLYRNNGDGTFTDVSHEAHLDRVLHTMGCNFGDLDNDGYPDMYLGTGDPDLMTLVPNRLFRNAEGKFFQDVTTAAHMGHLQKGHGCAFADLDNDGDQDVFMNMGGAFTGDVYRRACFLNPGFVGRRWITLKLEGRKANRSAIGARIQVNVDTPAGPRAIYKWVNSGGSFGANPLRAEIGLGETTAIRSVDVIWPAPGGIQHLPGVEPDHFYTLREGDEALRPWDVQRLKFDLTRPVRHPAPTVGGN